MNPPSKLNTLILVFALIVIGASAWRPQTPAAAIQTPAALAPAPAADECSSSRSIQVSGAATVYVTPDRALIQLGVQTNGTSPDAVHQENYLEIQRVINAVRGLGVDSKDIATDYYLVYPVYQDYSSLTISGYRLDNTISITLRDVSLADDVLLAALQVGANEVQDVQFYTSELRKYRDQARDLAMKAAGEKAQALAAAAGGQTGCMLNASENSWSRYYGSWRGSREANLWAQNAVQNASQGEQPSLGDSPVSLGQIAIQAEVNASFSLK